MTVIGIVLAILAFGIMIAIHELGHFLMAKKMGITVLEFSIGMGPKIFQTQKNGTKYSLRLLPIGGFVNMVGEDGGEEEEVDKEIHLDENGEPIAIVPFSAKPIWKRILVLISGVTMNLILGFVLAIIVTCSSGPIASMEISRFGEQSVSSSQLQIGDEIISIDGNRTRIDLDLSFALQRVQGNTAEVVVLRNGEIFNLEVPFNRTVDPESGVSYLALDFYVQPIEQNILTVLRQSFFYVISIVKVVWVSLIEIFTGTYGINDLSGPIGMTQQMGEVFASSGILPFLSIMCMISVNLAVMNLLPIPGLDGFRIWMLIIEKIIGRPVPTKIQGYINLIGIAILMLLMLYVAGNDILRIFGS